MAVGDSGVFRLAGSDVLAKLQAGDYDVAATKAKLNAAIDGPVPVMFSFTT
mgnify:CR=1 FL=1